MRPVADLAEARRYLEQYLPQTPDQIEARAEILAFLGRHPRDAHWRSCKVGHLTASALVVELEHGKILLTHHRKLDRWLQLGGHCDGDANLAAVALREAREESGIEALEVSPRIIDLDIHKIPACGGDSPHVHYDHRFLVVARRAFPTRVSHESNDLRWLTVDEALNLTDDVSVHRLVSMLQ